MTIEHKYQISIRIILLPILIFLIIDSFGQSNSTDKKLRNEIGITLFSYLPSPKYEYFPYEKQFHCFYVNGISYKRYFDDNVIRISISYRQVDENQDYPGPSIKESTYQEGSLRIGYNNQIFLFNQTTIVPYVGFDFIARIVSFKGTAEGAFPVETITTYESEENGLGLSPVVGFQINFTKRFSLNLGPSYDILRVRSEVKEVLERKSWRFGILISETNTKKIDYKFIFNPMCLCIISFRF